MPAAGKKMGWERWFARGGIVLLGMVGEGVWRGLGWHGRWVGVEEGRGGGEMGRGGVDERQAGVDERQAGVDERQAGVDEGEGRRGRAVRRAWTSDGRAWTRGRGGVDERRAGVDERQAGVDERQAGVDERQAGVDERQAGVDEQKGSSTSEKWSWMATWVDVDEWEAMWKSGGGADGQEAGHGAPTVDNGGLHTVALKKGLHGNAPAYLRGCEDRTQWR